MIEDTYTHYSGKTKVATNVNFEAWSRTLISFIRQKGLEQELQDWSGGWPCPITSLEKIGHVTAGELAHLRLGVSCIDLFGEVVPAGVEMVPVFIPVSTAARASEASTCDVDQRALAVADDIVRQLMERKAVLAVRNSDDALVPMPLDRQFQLKAAWQVAIADALKSSGKDRP